MKLFMIVQQHCKILEKFDNALRANDDIFFYNKYFCKVIFIANQGQVLAVDLYNINLDNENNFGEDDSDTII